MGALGDAAEARRQPGLDLGLDLARKNGRRTFGADGDDDRIAVDDRRHDERALARRIDHVHGHAVSLGRSGDERVGLWVIAGRKDDGGAGDIRSLKAAALEATTHRALRQRGNAVVDRLGDDADARAWSW